MSDRIRIGIIDSGVKHPSDRAPVAKRSFALSTQDIIVTSDDATDAIGHGTTISQIIANEAPAAEQVHAKVFDRDVVSSPRLIAAALSWLGDQEVRLINMSFGLVADRQLLRSAIAQALDENIVLVASAPAQGGPCYPAAYPAVIAVTGDARCEQGVVSDLAGLQADFGTWCASPERGGVAGLAGASIAAAHFTGLAGRWLHEHPAASASELRAYFDAVARFRGPERRQRNVETAP